MVDQRWVDCESIPLGFILFIFIFFIFYSTFFFGFTFLWVDVECCVCSFSSQWGKSSVLELL